MKKIIVFLLLMLATTTIFAENQQDTLVLQKKIDLQNEIVLSDIDSYGRIYICDKKGSIKRLDSLGDVELIFSPSSTIVPTDFSAQNPNQIFVFYQELQEWVVLNRFLTEIERYQISEKIEANQYGEIGFVRLLVPSANNTLWFFDESDFSLKNYDVLNKQVLSQTPLDLLLKNEEYPISYLQFYQGQVFLGVQGQGILIFDTFGNYKTTLKYPDWKGISFEKEFIFILKNDTIIKRSLYKQSEENIFFLDTTEKNRGKINYFFRYGVKAFCITETEIYIYTTK